MKGGAKLLKSYVNGWVLNLFDVSNFITICWSYNLKLKTQLIYLFQKNNFSNF